MSTFDLAGRTVAITGSTGGLGTALARALVARGAHLALLDLDQDAVDAQAGSLGGPTVARGWAVDVRRLDTLERAFAEAREHFGRVDVAIANAGVECMQPIWKMDASYFERVVDINLTGVWRTFRAALPHVAEQKGYLLGISSMAAFVHSPLQGAYTASKAGVWALSDTTRLEVRHLGVKVGSVHPTFFPTPMMDKVWADPAGLAIWGGNERGLWKTVPLDGVVQDIVHGITRRRRMIVCPRRNAFFARIPGLVQPFVDRVGFSDRTVRDAATRAKTDYVGS